MLDFINSMGEAIEKIEAADDEAAFRAALSGLRKYMQTIQMDNKCLAEVEKLSFYLKNPYSDIDNKERLEEAKRRVKEYILSQMRIPDEKDLLIRVLKNFDLYLAALWEREPHRRGGIKKEHLELLKIKNEYDVQFLLFAYLKPLYPGARVEVSEDTGYETVRTDIHIDDNTYIEVKCSHGKMVLKKMIEEIQADMVHYKANNLYFFIYDKEKIIDNPVNFIETYESKLQGKNIHIIVHQPKIL